MSKILNCFEWSIAYGFGDIAHLESKLHFGLPFSDLFVEKLCRAERGQLYIMHRSTIVLRYRCYLHSTSAKGPSAEFRGGVVG